MQAKTFLLLSLAQAVFTAATTQAQTAASPYPTMAPLAQYLMPKQEEIAFARTGAPKAISDAADVMVLTKDGYVTAVKGTNGFLCIVERGWASETTAPDFWNPKLRAPNCFNHAAASTFEQIYLMKTRLVLQGKTPEEIARATAAALDSKELPPLAPGAMDYMMSKQQYLGDGPKTWHPHLMFFVAGDAAKAWGADQPGSPVIAANSPEQRVTIFMVLVPHWSDGTPASPASH
jgi:hypothetical protein